MATACSIVEREAISHLSPFALCLFSVMGATGGARSGQRLALA
jgi:hypothetical protein